VATLTGAGKLKLNVALVIHISLPLTVLDVTDTRPLDVLHELLNKLMTPGQPTPAGQGTK